MQTIDVQALMRGLVHELRNPLSAVLTASNLLHGNASLDEETQMLLEIVGKEARRMNRILSEFSAFVKPPHPNPEPFNLARTLRDVLQEMQSDENWKNIQVRDDLPASLLVCADPIQAHLVLTNLVANAVEAMENGGQLHLSSVQEDEAVWLCIDDDGQGLSAESLQNAFQPFFSTKPSSTGLGLPIARVVLQNNGGDLQIENADKGARVKVCLPTPRPLHNS